MGAPARSKSPDTPAAGFGLRPGRETPSAATNLPSTDTLKSVEHQATGLSREISARSGFSVWPLFSCSGFAAVHSLSANPVVLAGVSAWRHRRLLGLFPNHRGSSASSARARRRSGQDGPGERYADRTRRLARFHHLRHPRDLSPGDSSRFLDRVAEANRMPRISRRKRTRPWPSSTTTPWARRPATCPARNRRACWTASAGPAACAGSRRAPRSARPCGPSA